MDGFEGCLMPEDPRRLYLGLQTPPDGRPHVVNRNNHISLGADAQREKHLSLLDPVFSGGEFALI